MGVGLDAFPKIALFKKENLEKSQTGVAKHKWKIAREQIDQRATTTIIWQPWSESVYCAGEHWEHAYELSKRRVVFQDLYETKRASCYLGERFQRQLTNEIVIPCNPPKLDEVIHMDDVVEGYQYWVVDQRQYSEFWIQKSIGPYNMIGHRSHNTDHVGVGSHLMDPRLLPNRMPPTLLSQNYVFYHFDPPQATLPDIQWSLPFYSETHGQVEVPVPMPSSCPVDFRGMNMTPRRRLNEFDEMIDTVDVVRETQYPRDENQNSGSRWDFFQ
ncbi:hypothetical protein MKW94_005664 [Papaver nudicaule]|uniref:Uncharacterized protein n=1 Tax=Papaver nudicaule TaxID=74823 RepID=A0AA41W0I4_PAPNU|nr:hypothetical protein [Papaver nudicaule]